MKRYFAAILALCLSAAVLALSLCGCSPKKGQNEETATTTAKVPLISQLPEGEDPGNVFYDDEPNADTTTVTGGKTEKPKKTSGGQIVIITEEPVGTLGTTKPTSGNQPGQTENSTQGSGTDKTASTTTKQPSPGWSPWV